MKNTRTSTACFQGDWNAVLDFLTGILTKDSVRKVAITRKEKHWQVDVTGLRHKKIRKSNFVGLYDLYW